MHYLAVEGLQHAALDTRLTDRPVPTFTVVGAGPRERAPRVGAALP